MTKEWRRRKKAFTVYIDSEVMEALQKQSKRLGVPMSALIRFGIDIANKRIKDAPGPGLSGLSDE